MLLFIAFYSFRKTKNRPKNTSKRHFFLILGTLQIRVGKKMLLETLMSDPNSVQKAFPHPPKGFLYSSGSASEEDRRFGTHLTIEL